MTSRFDYTNFTQYNTELVDVLKLIPEISVENFINYLLDARKNNKNIFIIGNGGSALNASHLAEDLAMGTIKHLNYNSSRSLFKAMSLTDNIGFITAVANDSGYEHIFTSQLKTYSSNVGDKLICISGSGNSKNVINAVEWANTHNVDTFCILGYNGGEVGKMVENNRKIIVNSWDIGIVESIHGIIFHYIINKLGEEVNK